MTASRLGLSAASFFRADGDGQDTVACGGGIRPCLREEVAAKKRAGGLLEHQAGLPRMRHMRRVDPAHALAAEIEHLAVGENAWRPVGEIVERDHAGDGAMHYLRVGCGGEPVIHRAALVGLHMAKRNPAQTCQWNDLRRGGGNGAETAHVRRNGRAAAGRPRSDTG